MLFGKSFNNNQQSGGALNGAASTNGAGLTSGGSITNGGPAMNQTTNSARIEITNVWTGPIIILSNDRQAELEKHYLNYSSTIPAESFEAIFRGQSLDDS